MVYVITGIKTGLGPGEKVPIRREVDEWWFSKEKNDLYQKSLFVYALHEFQKMDPTDHMSYFAIAGIHGQPLQSWDAPPGKDSWYCVHGSTLFPPWHRPYLALYEQRLYEIMLKLIPTTFARQDQAACTAAANSWRLPFWDSAIKRPDWRSPNDKSKLGPNCPYLLTVPKVEVLTKTGTAQVDNPMWRFKVPVVQQEKTTFGHYGITEIVETEPGLPDLVLKYDLTKSTSRYPETNDPKDPKFTPSFVEGNTQNYIPITENLRTATSVDSNTLPETVYRIFTEDYLPTWNDFATLGYQPNQAANKFSSLEDLHNSIHGHAGGNGHMGQVGVASFDPIFWMHHANVDRLFAMWQALYPDKYVVPWHDDVRGDIDVNTQLAPFSKNAAGDKFTAADVRDHTKLGYTYPELQKWLPEHCVNGRFNLEKYQSSIRTQIECYYSTTGKTITLLPGFEDVAKALMSAADDTKLHIENFPPALLDLKKTLVGAAVETARNVLGGVTNIHSPLFGAHAPAPAQPSSQPPEDVSWSSQDIIVNVLYDRFALGGHPYTIRIFLGEITIPVPKDNKPTAIQHHSVLNSCNNPNQVGAIYNFSSPVEFRGAGPEGCTSCRKQQESTVKILSTGQVILTDFLVEHIRKSKPGLDGACLDDLSKDGVQDWLKKNLHWAVTDQHNRILPNSSVPELKISVAFGTAQHCIDATVPSIYSNYEILYPVTHGRECGACPGDL
ncbi:putative tyrosinase [Amylocarpus encephaloides]|uniref:tyrosinase n=1 Tax=Amylocarpus encephaloides TaxID=45428 RepID=A0A9P7YP12_9HELO|nr:putative tyrosinase [Amylocarpus encephaloides]